MRIRTITPQFFKDEDLPNVPPLGRVLFIGLWCLADRMGRLEDRPERIRAEIFPYEPRVDVDRLLSLLVTNKNVIRYTVSQKRYIQIRNFGRFQRPHINEAESVIPPISFVESIGSVNSDTTREMVPDTLILCNSDSQIKERKGANGFHPPSVDEVLAYATDPHKRFAKGFHAYYTSNGWKVGKNKMVSWKAAFVGWVERNL